MIEVGKINKLTVTKVVDFGVFLDAQDLGNILLIKGLCPKNIEVGDSIDVFLYYDTEDELVATTKTPLAQVGDFAVLKIVGISNVGAFADIGLEKDLLIPFSEQRVHLEEDRIYLFYLYLDKASGRLCGTMKFNRILDKEPADYQVGEEVQLIVAEKSDMGIKMIINNTHWGLLFKTEILGNLFIGKRLKGYIRRIREDGKIDLSLQKVGKEKEEDLSSRILSALSRCNGFIPLSDKSAPEAIFKEFRTSKATYKRTIGHLYKQNKIRIDKAGIYLIKED